MSAPGSEVGELKTDHVAAASVLVNVSGNVADVAMHGGTLNLISEGRLGGVPQGVKIADNAKLNAAFGSIINANVTAGNQKAPSLDNTAINLAVR